METRTLTIDLFALTGRSPFVADGDLGLRLRHETVMPLLKDGRTTVIVLCDGIENMTDSFANAFFGPLCADFVPLQKVMFKACTPTVKSFIQSAWEIELRRREKSIDSK